MLNVVLWGFCGTEGRAIVDGVKAVAHVTEWFSDQEGAASIWNILLGRIEVCERDADAVLNFAKFYQQNFQTYAVMIHRRGLHLVNIHDLTNEFALSYYRFHRSLVEQKTQAVIFSNLPHEGADYVLYQVAKALRIRTIMCYQTIFANRFFLTTTMEDFGNFSQVPSTFGLEDLVIEDGYDQSLFYMQEVHEKEAREQSGVITKAINACVATTRSLIQAVVSGTMATIKSRRLIIHNPARRIIELQSKLRYEARLKNLTIDRQALRRKLADGGRFVYFPLHLQPELTTSATGGVFQDQVYAIEVLRSLLDDDWTILVKENPKQTYFQRGASFFTRLSNIRGVQLVDKLFPSVELIGKAMLTATITGTAGWETIKGGGKCLVFGQAWYATLEGCLTYDEMLDKAALAAFLASTTSVDRFRRSCEELSHKMGFGVVDPMYSVLVKEFDKNANAASVVRSLSVILDGQERR